ncbi:MAG: hypothetical protein HKN86_05060 [Acidimicrobiia bacterium]|nr:hypothetical protein [Acidimicrobiia bacterium]
MKFVSKKNGDVDIIFSDEEVKIFSETKKLTLTPIAVRHFENNLMRVIAAMHATLPENLKELQSEDGVDDEVPTK